MTQVLKIKKWVNGQPKGKPFSTKPLHSFANRGMVDQTLSALTKNGKLKRVVPGIYVKPKSHPILGEMTVSTEEVVQAIASHNGELIRPSGADAANRLGLSTQVPVQAVYLTSGRSRKVKIGKQSVCLKETHRKFLELAGQAGEIVRALRYLGKDGITKEQIQFLSKTIAPQEKKALAQSQLHLPNWMSNIIKELCQPT